MTSRLSSLAARWRAALRAGGRRRVAALAGLAATCGAVLLFVSVLTAGVLLYQGAENLRTAGGAVDSSSAEKVVVDGRTYARDPDVVAIALIGYDQRPEEVAAGRAGQADAVMVLALDVEEGVRRVIVIPRDAMVAVDQHLGETYIGQVVEQICLAYSYGDGRETSCAYTLDAMGRVLTGVPLAYYLAINMAGVGPMADALGGVELTPLTSIPDIGIVEGEPAVLSGFDAEWYLRWRDKSQLDSSMERQQRQKQFLEALIAQVWTRLAAGDIASLAGAYRALEPYLVSNMGPGEFLASAAAFAQGGGEDAEIVTLPGELRAEGDHAVLYLDRDAVRKIVLDTFYVEVG